MADNSSLNLDEVYEFAVELGEEAGAMLMKAAEARFGGVSESQHTEKESAVDLVTQTDIGESKPFIIHSSLRHNVRAYTCNDFDSKLLSRMNKIDRIES